MTFLLVTHTTFCNFSSFQLIVSIERLDLPEKTCSNVHDKRQIIAIICGPLVFVSLAMLLTFDK